MTTVDTRQRVYLGVNLNFAKFVYGHRRALDVARNQIGAHYVEMVSDIDYGPVFFAESPDRCRAHHRGVAEYAGRTGVGIPTMLSFYRDNVSVLHSNPEIREHAYTVMRAMAAQGGCLGCDVVGASFGTVLVEDYEERRGELVEVGIGYWQQWLELLHTEGVKKVTLETMSTLREPPATISSAKELLSRLKEYHRHNPLTTCAPALCCDVGHGAPEPERESDDDASFAAWFNAFPTDIVHIHLKNTGAQFLETWPFTDEYRGQGIIDLHEVARAIHSHLRAEKLYVMVEVPGKRGRLLGERESIKANRLSLENAKKAFLDEGFQENPEDHTWSPI